MKWEPINFLRVAFKWSQGFYINFKYTIFFVIGSMLRSAKTCDNVNTSNMALFLLSYTAKTYPQHFANHACHVVSLALKSLWILSLAVQWGFWENYVSAIFMLWFTQKQWGSGTRFQILKGSGSHQYFCRFLINIPPSNLHTYT